MAAIAEDPKTREWWQLTDALQQRGVSFGPFRRSCRQGDLDRVHGVAPVRGGQSTLKRC